MVKKKEIIEGGKRLTIEFNNDENAPVFTFNGTWVGRDVRVVLHHIARAYRHYKVTKAKAMVPRQEEQPQTVGATND